MSQNSITTYPFGMEAPQLTAALYSYTDSPPTVFPTGLAFGTSDTKSFGFLATLTGSVTSNDPTPFTIQAGLTLQNGLSTSVTCAMPTFAVSYETSSTDTISAYYTGSLLCPIANTFIGSGPATITPIENHGVAATTYGLYIGTPTITVTATPTTQPTDTVTGSSDTLSSTAQDTTSSAITLTDSSSISVPTTFLTSTTVSSSASRLPCNGGRNLKRQATDTTTTDATTTASSTDISAETYAAPSVTATAVTVVETASATATDSSGADTTTATVTDTDIGVTTTAASLSTICSTSSSETTHLVTSDDGSVATLVTGSQAVACYVAPV
ncbi:hypothetical protein BX600DRAFT_155633 [Xylariales sp. PMI_506]|nr:hypothetical protein BX600DRAFT_155633 [Xylariales sp. PMI_506]